MIFFRYYNGGLLPTKAILHKYPELVIQTI